VLVSPSANNVKALFQSLDKLWDIGGIMLQVSVHGDDEVTARGIEAGTQGNGLACVVPQSYDCNSTVYLSDLLKQGKTAVGAAIVYKHTLEGMARRIQRVLEPPVEGRDALALIPERNNYGVSNKSQIFGHTGWFR
jgi:hypothetical protein